MHRGAITRRLYMSTRGYTTTQIILWQFARILFSYKPGEKCLKLPEFLHEFLSHLEVVLQMHLPPLLQTRNQDINTNRITIQLQTQTRTSYGDIQSDLKIPFPVEVRITLVAPYVRDTRRRVISPVHPAKPPDHLFFIVENETINHLSY